MYMPALWFTLLSRHGRQVDFASLTARIANSRRILFEFLTAPRTRELVSDIRVRNQSRPVVVGIYKCNWQINITQSRLNIFFTFYKNFLSLFVYGQYLYLQLR